MSDTLLSYAVITNPNPIQTSQQQGNPSLVTLTIVVSNSTNHIIQCQGIAISLPVGPFAKDLCSNITGINTTAPVGWNMQQSNYIFKAAPNTPNEGNIAGAGLVFVFSNIPVNHEPGTFYLTIMENAAQQGGNSSEGVLNITLAKFPPQS